MNSLSPAGRLRAHQLYAEHREQVCRRTDRVFAQLLVLEWLAGIVAALWVSPRTWIGSVSDPHLHVYVAVLLGAAVIAGPLWLAVQRPGEALTRHTIAASQGLISALLIHLTGGRIETHFHVFGSLAFLSFYRDWRVLVTATAVVGLDHLVRGVVTPQSVFGVVAVGPWRWLEHVAWVLFEDAFLIYACRTGAREMLEIAARRAQLEATNETIEQQVRQRTAELAEARDAALDAARVKSEFLATVSHELRTPLNGIIGMTGFLLDGELDGLQRDHACTAKQCSETLLALVDDLLDFSRIEAGKTEFESIDYVLCDVLDEVVDMIGSRVRSKDVRFGAHIDRSLPARLRGDPRRVRQVLVNLAGNAVKFTSRGHVAIEVVGCELPGGGEGVRFVVRDTGIGIAAQHISRLFAPFMQADASTSRSFGGTGLGLAISKRLVEGMGGCIGLDSEPGAGSCFWFELPLVRCEAAPSEATAPALDAGPLERLRGVRVLLVEDNAINQRVALTMLARLGCRTDVAGNGLEALEALNSLTYDLVLMDCQMPELDGFQTTERIRAREQQDRDRRLPVVALTANALQGDRDRCLAIGMDGFLAKPLRMAELVTAIQAVLEPAAEAAVDASVR